MNLLIRISMFKIFVFLLFFIQHDSQAQWINQSSPVSDDLIDIHFVNKSDGWAVSKTNVIVTTDGGDSWFVKNLPDEIVGINKIQFVNSQVGFIIGDNGLIIKTTDGGENWEIITTDFSYNLTDLDFIDESTGWITGWEETNLRTGVILHTIDSGLTWEKQIEKSCNCLFNSTIFMSVKFLDSSIGWALGGDYADNFSETYIYFTENSGETWSIKGVWKNWPLINLKIVSKDTLWTSGGPLVLSFDGGETWTCPNLDNRNFEMYANSIAPVNGSKCWAVHLNPLLKQYGIYYTSDSGENWIEEFSFDESYALKMTNVVENHLWVAGKNGLIMRRNNVTSVEIGEEVIYEFKLDQNYPNPFNGATIISYSLNNNDFISISIYDYLGKEVTMLVNQEMNEGNYHIEWLPNNLSSGIYFYKLQTSKTYKVKKMIYLK